MVFSFKSPLCLSQAHKGQSFDHQTPGMGNLTAELYPVGPQAAHQRHVHSEGGVGTVSEPCPHSICVFQQLPPTSGGPIAGCAPLLALSCLDGDLPV